MIEYPSYLAVPYTFLNLGDVLYLKDYSLESDILKRGRNKYRWLLDR